LELAGGQSFILSFPVSLKVLAEPSVRMASWPRRRGDGWTDGRWRASVCGCILHCTLTPPEACLSSHARQSTLSRGWIPIVIWMLIFFLSFFFIVTKYYNRNCCVNIFFILALSLKIFIKIKPKISPIYFYIINIKLRYLSEYRFECFFPLFVVGSK
jgi:cellulose synthase/poly-beta-1,6-N-acetylglucosamine synthase-like glycosyltransferase